MAQTSRLGSLQLGGAVLGAVSTGAEYFDSWVVNATATAEFSLTPQTFTFSADAIATAVWYIKVLAGWYAELTASASWDLSASTNIDDWTGAGVFSAEWELAENTGLTFEVNGVFTAEWLGTSGGKDLECISGDGIAAETEGGEGATNYVF
jgi:hypothetical protein